MNYIPKNLVVFNTDSNFLVNIYFAPILFRMMNDFIVNHSHLLDNKGSFLQEHVPQFTRNL